MRSCRPNRAIVQMLFANNMDRLNRVACCVRFIQAPDDERSTGIVQWQPDVPVEVR